VSNRTRCRAAAIRGEFAIIVVIDRHLGLPAPFLTRNAEPQQLQIALAAAGQRGEQVEVAINVTLRRPELILPAVDGEQHSVPTADKLLRSMQVAGVGPSSTAGRRAVDTAGDAQCRIANEVVSGNEAPSPHVLADAVTYRLLRSPARTGCPPTLRPTGPSRRKALLDRLLIDNGPRWLPPAAPWACGYRRTKVYGICACTS
jgi:hypothetical protein